ncbi:acyltransferase [Phenylobacterium sp. LjRoot219]|uniref:acyltransferase family protein n=1 Tax=Phenylobacterium sp. LjRoot219 TaxID=3342283 RepID=UPI003ECDA3C5
MARQPTIVNLQALRFVAAFLVVIGHVQGEAARLVEGYEKWLPIPWAVGVDIFFAISGFVMVLTAADKAGSVTAAKEFLWRRLLRIGPIYWIFTTLAVAMAVLLHNKLSWSEVLASYAFLPWAEVPFDVRPTPILDVGWTLNYEMAFYTLFAVAMLLPKRWSLLALSAFLIALTAVHPLVPKISPPFFTWTNPIILEFVAGMWLGVAYRSGFRLPVAGSVALTMAGIALLAFLWNAFGESLRFITWGVPGFLIVAAVVLSKDSRENTIIGSAMKLGGDASYALYLSHIFSLNAVSMVWKKLPVDDNALAYIVFATLVSVPAGIFVHLFVERPVSAWIKDLSSTPVPVSRLSEV